MWTCLQRALPLGQELFQLQSPLTASIQAFNLLSNSDWFSTMHSTPKKVVMTHLKMHQLLFITRNWRESSWILKTKINHWSFNMTLKAMNIGCMSLSLIKTSLPTTEDLVWLKWCVQGCPIPTKETKKLYKYNLGDPEIAKKGNATL